MSCSNQEPPSVHRKFIQGRLQVQELNQLSEQCELPQAIKSDNSSEFTCMDMLIWADETGVQLGFIARGKPTQNGYIEGFNGRMRKEYLDRHISRNIFEAKEVIMNWASHYHEERPHRSLNSKAPSELIYACNAKQVAHYKYGALHRAGTLRLAVGPHYSTVVNCSIKWDTVIDNNKLFKEEK